MSGSLSEKCHFWRLPLEIRFLIYDLVYGADQTILLTLNHVYWELDNREKPRIMLRRSKEVRGLEPGVDACVDKMPDP